MTEQEKPKDDDAVDFSKLAGKATSFFKGMASGEGKETASHQDPHHSEHHSEKKDEPVNVKSAVKSTIVFTKNNAKWIIPLFFLLLAIGASTYYRVQPIYLPATENWARSAVHDYYLNQLENQLAQQYPNLPPQNRDALVQTEFEKLLLENEEQIANDINRVSQQYKDQFRNDQNGDVYMIDIDSYLWYSQARNVINHGHLGDMIIDGEKYFSLRNGRLGQKSSFQLHPYFAASWYKFLHFFNSSVSLMKAFLLLPALIIALALIPAFFIGRKLAGNVGGFFAAILLAVNGPVLSRSSADTDPHNVLMPLLIVWMFIEALSAESRRKQMLYSGLSAFVVGVYSATWGGWPFIFLTVLAVLGLTIVARVLVDTVKSRKLAFKSILQTHKKHLTILLIFLAGSGIFVTLFSGFRAFWISFFRPVNFIAWNKVGVFNVWPNVITTVAEFNASPLNSVISNMGGKILFWICLMGLVLLLVNKENNKSKNILYFIGSGLYYLLIVNLGDTLNNPVTFFILLSLPVVVGFLKVFFLNEDNNLLLPSLFTVWLLSTSYSFTRGSRFALLVASPFVILVGVSLGMTFTTVSSWLNKRFKLNLNASKVVLLLVLSLLLFTPFSIAENISMNQIPSINDSWYNALLKIKGDSEDSIITSWWDFGHWFVAVAERRATFDGGNQARLIHWVGRTLLTNDETEALGTLRMLNCGQETAPSTLEGFTNNDTLTTINILKDIFQISDRDKAYLKYQEHGLTQEQAATMLEYTHCQDLLPNYFITSEDMVGKAGVWGHFGSWNFERATMYQRTNSLERSEAVSYLVKTFNMTESQAENIHNEIQNTKGDSWIAPWPGYLSSLRGCDMLTDTTVKCTVPLQDNNIVLHINLETIDVAFEGNAEIKPTSLVYATKDDVKEKRFSGKTTGFSVMLIPLSNGNYGMMLADPAQAAGMFTRLFFFEGHGLKCFSKFDDVRQFTGGRIITWKVDYSCQQQNKVFFQPQEEVNAAHILILSEGRTDEEAFNLITQIKNEVTAGNFAELAEQYSEDGSAANGGNLGWFGRGRMVKEFENAAFSLDEGEISGIVKTQFGYHLIYLQDRR